jgi:hypothetical protein
MTWPLCIYHYGVIFFIVIPHVEFIQSVFSESRMNLIIFPHNKCLEAEWHYLPCLGAFLKTVDVISVFVVMKCNMSYHKFYFISCYSFSINPAGNTNSCGCGNRPSLQYNKIRTAQHTATQNRILNTIPVCKKIVILIKLSSSV